MKFPLSHFEWQILRLMLRCDGPSKGSELRITKSRRTMDGTFLDALVRVGLIEAVGVEEPPDPRPGFAPSAKPVQFRTLYRLTPKGEHAAEWGEFERAPNPQPRTPNLEKS